MNNGNSLLGNPNSKPSLKNSSNSNISSGNSTTKSLGSSSSREIELEQQLNNVVDELVGASPQQIVQSLATLIRYGKHDAIQRLIEELQDTSSNNSGRKNVDYLSLIDDDGHSLFHWACKRTDDVRLLQLIISKCSYKGQQLATLLDRPSIDKVGMCAIHWACTENNTIPHIALLLQHGANIESRDKAGCTPLLIAAQYGQVETVAYLIQKGANAKAVDSSWDTALHWAAYKGSIQVCGLLSYQDTLDWTSQDAYGQTPLHLAALRGHTSVVRYILSNLSNHQKETLLLLKDKNQRTPLDLAIHKQRPNVQAVLREHMSKLQDPRAHFFKKTLRQTLQQSLSIHQWKVWLGVVPETDELDEHTKLPFYFVLLELALHFYILITVLAPVFNVSRGELWDHTGLLLCNFFLTFSTWYNFYKTVTTNPGYLDDSFRSIEKWRNLYQTTLESYATTKSSYDNNHDNDNNNCCPQHDYKQNELPLCHTCHIARPLRSKHCRVDQKCVLMFDHYCPFVDNSVGLYNYKYFLFFLLSMAIGVIVFDISLIIYINRYHTITTTWPWPVIFIGTQLTLCLIPVCGMSIYHLQLTMMNLTTNEHLNVQKYDYLHASKNGNRIAYKNPWNQGKLHNIWERICNPSEALYLLPTNNDNNNDMVMTTKTSNDNDDDIELASSNYSDSANNNNNDERDPMIVRKRLSSV